MRRFSVILSGSGLLLIGYLLGSTGLMAPQSLRAEAEQKKEAEQKDSDLTTPPQKTDADKPAEAPAQVQPQGPSKLTLEKIQAAYDALADAADALEKEGYYRAATKEVNVFAVLSGGVDAVNDLQSGNGVDPETFAAIYAGTIKPEVQELLQRDSSNHYTYDGKLVQMYPVSELRRRFIIRAQLTGQVQQQAAPTDKPTEAGNDAEEKK